MKNCTLALFLLLSLSISMLSIHDALAGTVQEVMFSNEAGDGSYAYPSYTCNITSVYMDNGVSRTVSPMSLAPNTRGAINLATSDQVYFKVHYADCINQRSGAHNGFRICPDGTGAADMQGTGCPKYQSSVTFVIKTMGLPATTFVIEKR